MNQINAVTIGKLISAHREGDEEKFKAYVEFIADAYEQQGDDRAANIIRSNYTGGYGEQGKVILDEAYEQTVLTLMRSHRRIVSAPEKENRSIREIASAQMLRVE